MKSLFSAKTLAVAAMALGGVAATTAAQARSDVHFSIGFNAPYGYVQPAPVYVQPAPVYVQPQTIYYGHDRRFVQRSGAWGDWDRDGVPNIHDRDSRYYQPRYGHGRGYYDADRDGVPNRYDRSPHNPYRY
jgi:hypothetical protein